MLCSATVAGTVIHSDQGGAGYDDGQLCLSDDGPSQPEHDQRTLVSLKVVQAALELLEVDLAYGDAREYRVGGLGHFIYIYMCQVGTPYTSGPADTPHHVLSALALQQVTCPAQEAIC